MFEKWRGGFESAKERLVDRLQDRGESFSGWRRRRVEVDKGTTKLSHDGNAILLFFR